MRKIGKLNGIPIVEGDSNELNRNQIHYKEKEGGNIVLSKIIKGELKPITESSEDSSAGDGEGGSGESSIEYLDVSTTGWDALTMKEMVSFSAITKIRKDGVTSVYSSAFLLNLISTNQMTVNDLTQTIAIGFAKEASIQFSSTGTLNPVSGLVAQEPLASLPRITEEEFYNLN